MEKKDKRLYERPAMTAVELQHRAAVLTQTSDPLNRNVIMNVTYEEEDI